MHLLQPVHDPHKQIQSKRKGFSTKDSTFNILDWHPGSQSLGRDVFQLILLTKTWNQGRFWRTDFFTKLRGLVAMETLHRNKFLAATSEIMHARGLALGSKLKVLMGSQKKRVTTRTRVLNVTSQIVSSTRLRALQNLQLIHGISNFSTENT